MKTAARFLLLAVLASADVASASTLSRTAAGRALAPQQPLAPELIERADLVGGDAAQAAVAVTGGQAVAEVRQFPVGSRTCPRTDVGRARQPLGRWIVVVLQHHGACSPCSL